LSNLQTKEDMYIQIIKISTIDLKNMALLKKVIDICIASFN
jgi:hypothetical protein